MQEKLKKYRVCGTLTDEKKSGIIVSKLGDDKNNILFKGRKRCWIMYETVKVIRLSDMDEVKDFVRAAGGCDFDIDVKCDRTLIDAKSLLGMIGLGVKKNLQVCYGGKNENFENVVAKFAVA